jgi:hypothetical protein
MIPSTWFGPTATRPRACAEALEVRRLLALNIEDFSDDLDAAQPGFDSWDGDPVTAVPDDLQIPHDVNARVNIQTNIARNTTHCLFIPSGAPGGYYTIDFRPTWGMPGGVATGGEVVAVGFRFTGSGRAKFFGELGVTKTLDVSAYRVWDAITVTANDPSDSGGELGGILKVEFTPLEYLALDDVAVLVLDAGTTNNPPRAVDDSVVARAGAELEIHVLDNDVDADNDRIYVSGLTQPTHGTAMTVAGGLVLYTPGALGPDSFTYTISDGRGGSSSATVSVSVGTLAAQDDHATTLPGQPVEVRVLENDSNPGAFPLTVEIGSHPARGAAAAARPGYITYTPAPNLHGPDEFTYTIRDAFGNSSTAEVTVMVNTPPVAPDHTYVVRHGFSEPFTLPAPTLLDGVTDEDQDAVEVVPQTRTVASGTAVTRADGSFTFEPSRMDHLLLPTTFPYTVRDALGFVTTGYVRLAVPNAPPVAEDASTSYAHGTPTPVRIAAYYDDPEGDAVTVGIVDPPAHGVVTILEGGVDPDNDRRYVLFQYDSVFGVLLGTVRFAYTVGDPYDPGNVASVEIGVANTPPVGVVDGYYVSLELNYQPPFDSPGSVLDNDFDIDAGDSALMEAILVSAPQYGRLQEFRPDGTFQYIPPTVPLQPTHDLFIGRDRFTYRVTDGISISGPIEVLIDVRQDPGPQSATADFYSMPAGLPLTVFGPGLLANDEPDHVGDAIWPIILVEPAHGELTLSRNGGFRYEPDAGFVGVDCFTYANTDGFRFFGPGGRRHSDQARVFITSAVDGDLDGDGTPDAAEGAADRNADGVPDHLQPNVVTLTTPFGPLTIEANLTVSSSWLTQVQVSAEPPAGTPPRHAQFPFGFLSFRAHTTPGALISFVIYTPEVMSNDATYWKYGPTSNEDLPYTPFDETLPRWFVPDSVYLISAQRLTFVLQDGIAGDDDLQVNGEIVDPGGIALPRSPATPVVEQVFASGRWSQAFRDSLHTAGTGDAAFGCAVDPVGAIPTLPFANVNQVSFRFNRNVAVRHEDLAVSGVTVANYPLTGFAYDPVSHVATWTLGRNIGGDRVRLALSSAVTGAAVVVPLNVLPGDVNGDGRLNTTDLAQVRARLGTSAAGPGAYNVFSDLNGDGRINATDLRDARAGQGRGLPAVPPSGSALTTALLRRRPRQRSDLFNAAEVIS